MAISSAIGNLNITTGAAGTTVSVTGLSFQPKVLILWWNGLTAASNGTRTSSERGMGWAVSASSFVSLATFDVDAVGTSMHGLLATGGGAAGTCDGIKAVAGTGGVPIRGDITGNITGTLATLTTYTGNTPQTGDSFARLGAPAGASTAVDIAAVKSDTTTLLGRITATLFSGITSLAQWLGLLAGKQVGDATARTELRATGAGSGTFDETTDSEEAIRDRGDAAWATVAAAAIRSAVGLAAADLDAQLAALPTAAENADAVWDEDATAHQTQGSFGQAIGDPVADANTIYKAVVTDAAGATVGVDIVAVKAETAAILDDTDLIDDGTSGLAKIATDVAAILVDTGTTLDARIPAALVGGRIDATVDGTGMEAGALALINAEVVDALATDTYAEPGQEAPGATVSLSKKIGYLYKFMRNKITQTSTTLSIFNDDAATVDHKATVSDDGTTATRGEIATGP